MLIQDSNVMICSLTVYNHFFQKFRLYLRRVSGVSQHHNGLGNSFLGTTDPQFGSISSLNGVDLQALAASGQIPPQSLASIQAAALGRATSKSSAPFDQRNVFNFENPKLRFIESQQTDSSKQVNLLHGIPTNMDSKQLINLHQSGIGNMNMMQSRTQILNKFNGSHVSNLPPSSSAKISRNSFPLGSNSGISGTEIKGSRGFLPNYDVLNNLNQNRNHEWRLQNIPQHSTRQGGLDVSPSVQVQQQQQQFSSSQNRGQSRIMTTNTAVTGNITNVEKSLKGKAESLHEMGFNNGLLHERFGQEDLMSALLKQVDFSTSDFV